MMEQWTLFPTVLQRKFLLTLLAGIASAGISVIICVATIDHILLALGIVVLCACLISCRGIWATATHKNYEVVEGICAGISTPMFRRYRKVHGSLLRPLSVGRGALLHAGGNIYHTSRVVAILEESEDCIRFETQNSHYHLSMSPFPLAAVSPLPVRLAACA